MKKILDWFKSEKFDFILVLILIVLVNLVSNRSFFRIDLTSQKSYSISQISKDTVKNLSEPLSVNVFFSDDLPAPYNSVEQYLHDILYEYKSSGGKNFTYRFFDMTKEENKKLAQEYGLSQVQVQKVETTEVTAKAAWMGIAISYGNNIRILDSLETTAGLEYKITTLISKMISTTEAIASLSGNDSIKVTLYPANDLKGLGIANLDKVESEANKAFQNVNKKFGEKLSFEILSAKDDSAKAVSEEYGLPLITYEAKDGSENHTVLGAVISFGDQFRLIPISLEDNPFLGWTVTGLTSLEENLSDAVEGFVTRSVEIGYVTGHGENSLEPVNYQLDINAKDSSNMKNLLSDLYTIKEINLEKDGIPFNIKTIMINGPKSEFSEKELLMLDQFVMKGGNLLCFLEPLVEQDNGPNAPPSYSEPVTGLTKLLSSWGIKPEPEMVMDESCYQARGTNGSQTAYWIPLVTRKNLSRKNAITKNIGAMYFLENGGIDIDEAEKNPDVSVTVLASSSEKSWTMKDGIILYPGYIQAPEDSSKEKPENLAVLLEGKFKSAFDNSSQTKSEKGFSTDSLISKSIQKGKVLLVSSSAVTTSQLVDQNGTEPMSLFIHNAVDYMNGTEGYCDMRSKGNFRNYLDIKNPQAAIFARIFNLFGLALIVAFVGLLVWRIRSVRREEIRLEYDADDKREISNNGETK